LIDSNFLYENIKQISEKLLNKGYKLDSEKFIKLYESRKSIIGKVENLKSDQNKFTKKIAVEKRKPNQEELESIKKLIEKIKDIETERKVFEDELNSLLLDIPNIYDEKVPIGKTSDENIEIKRVGKIPVFDFVPKDHTEIGKDLNLFDLDTASNITGTRFNIYTGLGAKLERALINFMLDEHSKKGYKEIFPPFICNEKSFIGTGNLPKFKEDLFKIEGTNYFLIPTAEVPLTNIFSDKVINEVELPIKLVAYSACFRSEAGSYGKDVKGLIRQHQFNKVELVKFSKPDESNNDHNELTADACDILDKLGLPYRVVLLCSGDTSFSSSITYDLEVWLPSENQYREISSCSNFKDFQSRRSNIKFKGSGKALFPHTLNGSGLAIGRTLVAILENYQQKDGSVKIPAVLFPYMNHLRHIKKNN
tara:strand:- start:3884 stop:5149 length:1266 start_codon:yes stop_codon:yes gene_type:complete